SSSQDAELFLLGAQTARQLRDQIDRLLTFAARLSRAELSDLASHLESTLDNTQVRAAVIASTPADLVDSLGRLRTVAGGARTEIDAERGVFFGARLTAPRIGFLFPGQGSPSHLNGGALVRRFG